MRSIVTALVSSAIAALACLSGPALAQDYPLRPVKVVVGFAPGGFTDVLARLVAQKLTERTGQRFVVENKAGAGGTIGAAIVAGSKPDGYTLLMGHMTANSIAPALYPKIPYDVVKDFTPITRIASTPFFLVVHPKIGVNNLKDFIELARKQPGALRFASSGLGTAQHLAAEQFMLATNTRMVHIPYKGSGQAIVDLLSGHVDLEFESPPNTLQHIRAGRLTALGITSSVRSSLAPQVPTIAEQGLPGFEMVHWFGMFGPASLPAAISAKLNAEIQAIMRSPEVSAQIEAQGGKLIPAGPEEFAEFVVKDSVAWGKMIREAGIKVE
jgi:tripartite-type tricarboxylate transporter receptor subunit TctC